jgi:hypothetical protein
MKKQVRLMTLKDEIKKIILAAEEGCECQQRPCDVCADGIAQRIADSLVVDEDEIDNILKETEILCEYCGGTGYVGYAKDGRKVSCEYCGGHEDSLGRGYNISKIAKAIAQSRPLKCEVK